jgi:hypothetical protein
MNLKASAGSIREARHAGYTDAAVARSAEAPTEMSDMGKLHGRLWTDSTNRVAKGRY